MHQAMQYYIWHKFGVSQDYNTFNQHPWHGTGQGTADAALQYITLSDTLINVYHMKIVPQMLTDPTRSVDIIQSLKAFIDDVVLHATPDNQARFDEPQHWAQVQLTWWTQLVQVTGGELNPKSVVALYTNGNWTSKGSCS